MTTPAINPNSFVLVSLEQLDAMDLSTAMQVVQGQRAELVEQVLKDELKEVQRRNQQISNLNTALNAARELASQISEKDGTSKKISDVIKSQVDGVKKDSNSAYRKDNDVYRKDQEIVKQGKIEEHLNKITAAQEKQAKIVDEFNSNNKKDPQKSSEWKAQQDIISAAEKERDAARKITVYDLPFKDEYTKAGMMQANLKAAAAEAGIDLNVTTKGELQTAVENIKTMVDSLGSTQQLSMLRLQKYTNIYNETFEMRTNMIKRDHDTTMSITANMRS